jgi:hypothetical protein
LLFGQFTCGADQRGLLVFGVFLEHGFIILKFFAFVPFCSEVIYVKNHDYSGIPFLVGCAILSILLRGKTS